MSDQLQLTPRDSLTIVSSEDSALVVEAHYGGGGSPPPMHFHPAQDEHFEILEGRMHAAIGGDAITLATGDDVDVLRGVAHQMWNADDSVARVRWTTSPRGRTESFFRAVDRAWSGSEDGLPDSEKFMTLLHDFEDTFRLDSAQ